MLEFILLVLIASLVAIRAARNARPVVAVERRAQLRNAYAQRREGAEFFVGLLAAFVVFSLCVAAAFAAGGAL